MKRLVFLPLLSALFANPVLDLSNPEVLKEIASQCNAIFETRKKEISLDLQKLSERQNTINILNQENIKLLKQKQDKLNEQEKTLQEMYKNMKEEEEKSKLEAETKLKEASDILQKNEKILEKIKGEKDSKLSESYAKMKDSAAAQILSNMSEEDAINILLSLQAKQVGLILSKMQPGVAAALTQALQYYPNKKPAPASVAPAPSSEGLNIDKDNGDKDTKNTGYKVY